MTATVVVFADALIAVRCSCSLAAEALIAAVVAAVATITDACDKWQADNIARKIIVLRNLAIDLPLIANIFSCVLPMRGDSLISIPRALLTSNPNNHPDACRCY